MPLPDITEVIRRHRCPACGGDLALDWYGEGWYVCRVCHRRTDDGELGITPEDDDA